MADYNIEQCFRKDYCKGIWDCPLREEMGKRVSTVLRVEPREANKEAADFAFSVYPVVENGNLKVTYLLGIRDEFRRLGIGGCRMKLEMENPRPMFMRVMGALHQYWLEHFDIPRAGELNLAEEPE